jgi:hypothetical protein
VHFPDRLRISRDSHSLVQASKRPSQDPNMPRCDSVQYQFWRDQGLGARAAAAVAASGCQSVDEIRDLGCNFFRRRDNCGPQALQQISELVGWPDAPPQSGAWVRRVSDDVLIEELRGRGITVEYDDAP